MSVERLERAIAGRRSPRLRSAGTVGLMAACLGIPLLLGRPPPKEIRVEHDETPIASPAMTRPGYDRSLFSEMDITCNTGSSYFSPVSAVKRWEGEEYYELSRETREIFSYRLDEDPLVTLMLDRIPSHVLVQGYGGRSARGEPLSIIRFDRSPVSGDEGDLADHADRIEGNRVSFRASRASPGTDDPYFLEVLVYYGSNGPSRDGEHYEDAERYLLEMVPYG